MKMENIQSISSIANKYDVYIFDIFGVLHDGFGRIEPTYQIIRRLSDAGKYIFLLTNSPHRAYVVVDQLKKLGFDASSYHGILTAGDQTYCDLRNNSTKTHQRLGRTCYFIGTKAMRDILPTDKYEITTDIKAADFILVAGPENSSSTLEQYEDILLQAIDRSLPMICSNPDIQVFSRGRQEMRAGRLAAFYQTLGGKVYFYGKPHAATYEMVGQLLKGFRKERMLIIGDSLYTDVRGANNARIDSLLLVSQNTMHEIGCDDKSINTEKILQILHDFNNQSIVPTYLTNELIW